MERTGRDIFTMILQRKGIAKRLVMQSLTTQAAPFLSYFSRRFFASKKKKKKQHQKQQKTVTDTLTPSSRLYELDNRRKNKKRAAVFEKVFEKAPVSKKLLNCQLTKDFINYAQNAGANVKQNGGHVKVSLNGVTTGFQSPGKKQFLIASVRKQKIEAFKAMGIAWDNSSKVLSKSVAEQVHDVLVQDEF